MSKLKESLNKLFQEHRVIFWHDEEEKMRTQYEELTMDGIVKQEVKDNEFWIKHQITGDKADQKFLLYFPDGAPADEDNWLLYLQKKRINTKLHLPTSASRMYLLRMTISRSTKSYSQKVSGVLSLWGTLLQTRKIQCHGM